MIASVEIGRRGVQSVDTMVAQRAPLTPRTYAIRLARFGTLEEKFWPRVERGPGCWRWLAGHNVWGYGIMTVAHRTRSAHRISWELHYGPIPEGMQVCHQCDVRDCVRPDHLFLGTPQDNVADMDAKGRRGRGWHPIRRGETHQRAKLSNFEVESIREAVAAGELHRVIAARHGITRQYVGMLAQGLKRV